MRIMIPVDENKNDVCASFGRAPFFLIYNDENNEYRYIENEAAEAEGGAGVKAAQIVVDNEADILITIRCGENANEVFKLAGVKIYKSTVADAKENIALFKENKLAELTKFHAGYHGIR